MKDLAVTSDNANPGWTAIRAALLKLFHGQVFTNPVMRL
jgi:hypothetical protein